MFEAIKQEYNKKENLNNLQFPLCFVQIKCIKIEFFLQVQHNGSTSEYNQSLILNTNQICNYCYDRNRSNPTTEFQSSLKVSCATPQVFNLYSIHVIMTTLYISTAHTCYPAQGISHIQIWRLVLGKFHPMWRLFLQHPGDILIYLSSALIFC